MESTMEEKPQSPANGNAGKTSGPASTASVECDEEKGDALDTVAPLPPGVHDGKAETDVKAIVAPPEETAKRKGKTALIMVAICVREVYNVLCILGNSH
jgi:hypothetical protein